MSDEVTIQVESDPQAEMDARSATLDAEAAAREAELAAAAAAGATVAQSQLIGAVMEHAREDARDAASDAEQAAATSEAAAEQAVVINTITAEMWLEIEKRVAALEARGVEVREESAPDVAEIGQNEQTPEEESTETGGGVPSETGGGSSSRTSERRPHGRRGR